MSEPTIITELKKYTTFGLYGVDNNCFALRIGSVQRVFEALEDENDGYRSMLQDLVCVTDPNELAKLVFSRRVLAQVRLEDCPQDANLWRLVDVKDAHVWLEFGTHDDDSGYYPTFVFTFDPKPGNLFYRARAVEKAILKNG